MTADAVTVEVLRATARAERVVDGARVLGGLSVGPVLAAETITVPVGAALAEHDHRDVEIVTWPITGSLRHADSAGRSGVLVPGMAQRLTAGAGVRHTLGNDAWRLGGARADEPAHLLQLHLDPGPGATVSGGYEQIDLSRELAVDGLVVIASGCAEHREVRALSLQRSDVAVHAVRLASGGACPLPAGPLRQLYLLDGAVELPGAACTAAAGDVVLLHGPGPVTVVATTPSVVGLIVTVT